MDANETTEMGVGASAPGTRRRAVTAFFEDRAAAQTAIDDLIAEGIERSRVTLVEGGAEPVAHEAVSSDHKGLWQSVKDLFMADEDRHAYGEGLRRGGFLLSVETGDQDHDRIVDLLDRDGAVDIDARAADWTLEGWDPVRAAEDLRPSAAVGPAFGRDEPRTAGAAPADRIAPAVAEPSVALAPVLGAAQPRTEGATPHAAEYAASRLDPQAIEPSAAVGPALGTTTSRPMIPGPTAIRDPGTTPSRLRSYIEQHVRHDPQDVPE